MILVTDRKPYRYLNGQTQIRAMTSCPTLSPGQVLNVNGGYGIEGSGIAQSRSEKPDKINLSDQQLELLMCICDVMTLLSPCAPPAGRDTS